MNTPIKHFNIEGIQYRALFRPSVDFDCYNSCIQKKRKYWFGWSKVFEGRYYYDYEMYRFSTLSLKKELENLITKFRTFLVEQQKVK